MIINYDIESMYPHIMGTMYSLTPSLKISEGTWHGAKYHSVEPILMPWDLMLEWSAARFGDQGDLFSNECCRWYANDRKFWFRNETDLTLFVLKWSM